MAAFVSFGWIPRLASPSTPGVASGPVSGPCPAPKVLSFSRLCSALVAAPVAVPVWTSGSPVGAARANESESERLGWDCAAALFSVERSFRLYGALS